jgi:DNA-binding transcriptional MerR regulator
MKIPVNPSESAKELMQKHGMSRATAWRIRKNKLQYYTPKHSQRANKTKHARMLEIFRLPAINYKELCKAANVPPHSVNDAIAGKSMLATEHFNALKKQLQSCKAQIQRAKNTTSTEQLRSNVAAITYVHWRPFLTEAGFNINEYDQIMRWKRAQIKITDAQKQRLKWALDALRIKIAL